MTEDRKDILQSGDKIIIVAAEIYSDLIGKNIHPLDNPKTYDFINGLSIDQQEKLLRRQEWRTNEFNRFKQELGYPLTTCIFHPGVDTRQKDFITYAKQLKGENPEITPLEAIQNFGNSLGDLQIYRGMVLTEQEASVIEKTGILGSAMLDRGKGLSSLSMLLDPNSPEFSSSDLGFSSTFGDDASARSSDLGVKMSNNFSISTSAHKEVASSVGWHEKGRIYKEGVAPYIFTLQVPKILCYQAEDINRDYRGPTKVKIGDKVFDRNGLEIFVPFAILPEYIKRIERTEIPPNWLGAR